MLSDEEIAAAYDRAKEAWPAVRLPAAQFAKMVREQEVQGHGLRSWAGDLFLACAAANGHEEAVGLIDRAFIAPAEARVRRLGTSADATADVLQVVRERLFSGPSPRIRAYNATGPLAQWIKVIAIRAAIDVHRTQAQAAGKLVALDFAADQAVPDLDPAVVALAKRRYKAALERALVHHVTALSPRDRAVLRQHLVEGLSIEKIAAERGVHRATVARWIWSAGEQLLEGIRRYFQEHYGMVPRDCDSLAHLLRSAISLDLPRLLTDTGNVTGQESRPKQA